MLIEPFPKATTVYIKLDSSFIQSRRLEVGSLFSSKPFQMKDSTLRGRYLSEQPEVLLKEDGRNKILEDHKQEYMVEYRKNYRKRKKRVNITLSNDEFKRLEEAAEQGGKKPTGFAKDVIIKEVDKVYLLPEDEKVENLILQIRSIGNNINQLTRHIHRSGFIGPGDINQLRASLKQIETVVETKLSQPEDLLGLVKKELETNPLFQSQLIELTNKFTTNDKK